MEYNYKKLTATMLLTAALSAGAYANSAEPTNLKADIFGTKVTLTWERSGGNAAVLSEDFEGTTFPSQGWTTKSNERQ